MVAFRLICDLLHCHVSDAKSPLAAISFRAAKLGCSRSGMASSLMVRRKPCMGSRVLGDPAADARATVPNNGTSMVAFRLFFLSEPVAFRRVYGLESYSRTSGESNHHRQSVSDTGVPRYQLHHEDD